MSNAHQINELAKLAVSLAKFAEANEKLSLPLFSIKLATAQQSFPEDYTIGMMATVVSRMANSDKLFISRAEVKDLYEKFYSRNSKFAVVFEEELGKVEEVPKPTLYNREGEGTEAISLNTHQNLDGLVLSNSLNQAFGTIGQYKAYTDKQARQAADTCNFKLATLGFEVSSEVADGRRDVLVCSASFDTPRGKTSVLIPVECVDDKYFPPTVFIANTGTQELNRGNLMNYLVSHAGEKLHIQAGEIFVAKIKNADLTENPTLGVKEEIFNPNLLNNLKVEEPSDPELSSIAHTFDTELGLAVFKFGKDVVVNGGSLVSRQLNSCGLPSHQIAILSSTDNDIIYSVSVNGGVTAFKVPVKVENGRVMPPSVVLCGGAVKSFDQTSIAEILKEGGFDRVAASSASPVYGMKPSELINIVRSAVSEGNYIKAEDALNVLANSDDNKAYQVALGAFSRGLKGEKVIEGATTKCAMIVKSKHSQHDMCGHTGLPLHEVYQDKHNQCQKLYRKAMDETNEGAGIKL